MTRFTHFYSDPHYGHANIIKHASRPFGDVAEMNRELERRYREVVGPDDHVLWCGDCFWTGYDGRALLARLPGRKSLCIGNHDGTATKMMSAGFEMVTQRLYFDLGPHQVLANHFPPLEAYYEGRPYDGMFRTRQPSRTDADYIIHGHTHERLRINGNRIHVGVDAWDYAPVSEAELLELMTP
jgi:calcineurin-like phosphoesterase family protein